MNRFPVPGTRRMPAFLVLLLLLWPSAPGNGGPPRTSGVSAFRDHAGQMQLSLSLRIAEAKHDERLRQYLRCLLRYGKRSPELADRGHGPSAQPSGKRDRQ